MSKSNKRKATSDAGEILDRRHPATADDLDLRAAFRQDIEIAELIHQVRTEAGLS